MIMDSSVKRYAGIDPEKVLEIILESIYKLVDYELAVVMEVKDGNFLRVLKADGPLYISKLDRFEISLSQRTDIAGLMEKRVTHLFQEDEDHLDTYYELLELPDNHSCLVSPLYAGNKAIGLLTLDHSGCGMFTEQVVNLIDSLSKLIAISLSQITAVEEIYQVNRVLADERNNLLEHTSGVLGSLIGNSDAWNRVKDNIRLVASSDTPVLIEGETGTGKEVAARAVHSLSPRSAKPFVAVNCSAISSSLAESEFFGHEKGSFTGADFMRKGRFELADGGTLFLDEVGDLPPEIQPKLLRVLQEGCFERVGGEKAVNTDVRIIAATNIDLQKAVAKGKFREDLFYRLSVFPVKLPPLRERENDVILLADYFLDSIKKRLDRKISFSGSALSAISESEWKGNVRELQNCIERAVILSGGNKIGREHIQCYNSSVSSSHKNFSISDETAEIRDLDSVIKNHIIKTLFICEGRIYGRGGAAELLGLKPTTLQSKMKKLGIKK